MLVSVWGPTAAASFVWWGVEDRQGANVSQGTGSPMMEPPASQMKVGYVYGGVDIDREHCLLQKENVARVKCYWTQLGH